MSQSTYQPRGLYFEDFESGMEVVTRGRTITEADVVNFAGVTGDYNQIHTDAKYAESFDFGKRIAHGLLVQSVGVGLAVMTGFIDGTILAFRELNCKFSKPVFLGDTIHVRLEVVEKKAFRRLGGGNVTMQFRVISGDDEVVQRGEWVMLVKSRE